MPERDYEWDWLSPEPVVDQRDPLLSDPLPPDPLWGPSGQPSGPGPWDPAYGGYVPFPPQAIPYGRDTLAQPVPDTPTGGGGGGGPWGYLTQPFTGQAPRWNPWSPTAAPSPNLPPPFSYKEFVAPTRDSMYADPSYQWRLDEGNKALAQRIASTGAYRTGGTLKDFINYNQNAASQEYGNIFDRATTAHNLGLTQALGTYGTNYGVQRDETNRLMDVWKASNQWGQQESQAQNQREFDAFLADYDIFNSNRKRAGDYLFTAAGLG